MTTEGGQTVYYVRDNGIGIDPQNLHNVFGLFDRSFRDKTTTKVASPRRAGISRLDWL